MKGSERYRHGSIGKGAHHRTLFPAPASASISDLALLYRSKRQRTVAVNPIHIHVAFSPHFELLTIDEPLVAMKLALLVIVRGSRVGRRKPRSDPADD